MYVAFASANVKSNFETLELAWNMVAGTNQAKDHFFHSLSAGDFLLRSETTFVGHVPILHVSAPGFTSGPRCYPRLKIKMLF